MKTDFFRRLTEWLKDAFFPLRCPFCGRVIERSTVCCAECLPKLPRTDPEKACPRCGKRQCGCSGVPLLTSTRSSFYYEGCADFAVQRLKFGHRPGAAIPLGRIMAETVREEGTAWDLITAVPMTRRKVRRRGYNQSELLAGSMAKELGIPYTPVLHKIRETRAQHTLDARARTKNLSGAYRADPAAEGKRILICDDVLTTGATLREAASALLQAGAKEVGAVTLCSVERERS